MRFPEIGHAPAYVVLLTLALAVSWGCGGKYEMPSETDKEARMGEYIWVQGYDWFGGAASMAVKYGHIYVAYSDEGAVKRYYADGVPERDIVFNDVGRPVLIGVGGTGVAVADSSDGLTVKVYGLSGGSPTLVLEDPEWKSIGGLALDDAGNVYVSDSYRNFVRSYNTRGRLRFGVDLADSGFGIGHVLGPQGLLVDGETLLIAEADGGKAQVQKISTMEPQKGILISAEVPLLRSFVDDDGGEALLVRPIAVNIDDEGRILVLDAGLGKIFRYTPEGISDVMVNSTDTGGPQNLATSVALGGYNNRVYALDKATGRVLRWDPR
jgi:hypothetical protein